MTISEQQFDEQELDLSIEDLELEDVKVIALSTEDAKGLPEMGATIKWIGCCSCCCT